MNERLLELVHAELIEQRKQLRENTAQLRENTVTLEEHHRRSLHLEERMAPIERGHIMWGGVGKGLTVIGTVTVIVGALARFLA